MSFRSTTCLLGAWIVLFSVGVAHAGLTLSFDTTSLARAPGESSDGLGFLSGEAIAHQGTLEKFDIVFLLDISVSTRKPSGADIDRDGRKRGRPDSILAAEVASVSALLDQMDPRHVRVGIAAVSGGGGGGDQAWVEVEMTNDFDDVREGLQELLLLGPQGGTNMQAGLRIARLEVRRRARTAPARKAARHVVLLTDGIPDGAREATKGSENTAMRLARKMGKEKIRVHAYAIGPKATQSPRAAVQIAKRSGGSYVAVNNPADLKSMLSEINFSAIEELRIRNLTTDQRSSQQVLGPDGVYSALVPIRSGENEIEVYARSSDGSEKRERRSLVFESGRLDAKQQAEVARLLELNFIELARKRERREIEIEAEGKK